MFVEYFGCAQGLASCSKRTFTVGFEVPKNRPIWRSKKKREKKGKISGNCRLLQTIIIYAKKRQKLEVNEEVRRYERTKQVVWSWCGP